ncbi:SERPINE1 mRNA-binding protein 1-like [Danaus plexippus]|uniref:Plasminogen activator inhibitor 1 RNA-binding protein n=1 Tax=Danaus plexippus plexippus TaxID=278856 RepID=A0A212FEW1_DANPL|nr:SERPINE1 mRNA-binding protein 1-like [Danaus plexippus]OWR52260.1 Plasminogen activator inhibitor 1 RNA-binding protein [Danaus plexippus plexippus]
MENSYGVGTDNRYALFLDDESDPLDALKAREQAKELKKKTKEAEKENKGKPEAKPKGGSVVTRKGIKETQNVKSQEIKSGEQQKNKGPPRTNDRNSERPPPRRREDRPQNGAVEGKEGARPPRREFGDRRPNFERRNFNDNSEGGERRGPRPPREPREGQRGPRPGFDGRGKREFDRRSGSDKTGVKPVDKREGAGPHNWGTIKDDIDELNKTGSEGEVAEEKAPDATGAGDGQQSEPERAPPAEEEPRELTLDEYKALRNAQRMAPQYNLRKAGEGEDLSQWKNLVLLEKKKEGGEEDDSDEEYDIADYPQRVGRQKRVLGIEFTFNDTARRGGTGGRGRGRGRGRGGRGGGTGAGVPREEAAPEERPAAKNQVAPPKVDDSKDFPSLS